MRHDAGIKLSFIVPMFNCGVWINRCLDFISSIKMVDNDYEVIVVDDGSQDGGGQIVEQYKKQHKNIILIRQKNSGASAARNRGLEAAKGEWIWFVDADDTILPDILAKDSVLRNEMDGNADMIVFNYQKQFADHVEEINNFHGEEVVDGCSLLLRGELYLWNRLFRRSTLEGVRFVEGTKNIEDFYFDICAMLPLKHVVCLPVMGYSYNQQNMSSTSRNATKENLQKLSDDTQTIYKHLLNDIKHLQEHQRNVVTSMLRISVAGYLYSLFMRYDSQSLRKGIAFLRANSLYPAKRTTNRKANLFLLLANHENLFLLLHRIILRRGNK